MTTHDFVALGLQLLGLAIVLGIAWGVFKSRIESNASAIKAVRDDVKAISNGFSSQFARRETLQAQFGEINRRFDAIDIGLRELKVEVRRSGCEYPSCAFGQLLSATGSAESVLEAIRRKKERERDADK